MLADLVCMLGLFSLLYFIFFRSFRRRRAQQNVAMQSLAAQHGFMFNPNHAYQGTVMSGTLGSHRCDVSFETVRRRSRRNRSSTYMHITVPLNAPLRLGLLITRQGFLTEGLRLPDTLTGNQDIIVGDKNFDDTYRVKGMDENAVQAYFTPQRIQAVLQFQRSLGPLQNLTMTDQQLNLRFPGVVTDMDLVSETAKGLVWLVQQLEA